MKHSCIVVLIVIKYLMFTSYCFGQSEELITPRSRTELIISSVRPTTNGSWLEIKNYSFSFLKSTDPEGIGMVLVSNSQMSMGFVSNLKTVRSGNPLYQSFVWIQYQKKSGTEIKTSTFMIRGIINKTFEITLTEPSSNEITFKGKIAIFKN